MQTEPLDTSSAEG